MILYLLFQNSLSRFVLTKTSHMLTLGFSSMYYTLWEVGEPEKKYTSGATVNGVFMGTFQLIQRCTYIQNLSKDHDTAVAKITEISGGMYGVDLDLRGKSTFVRGVGAGNDMPDYVFSFGQLMGKDIREATDVWQLKRAVKEESGKRRRAYARRRLIDLGELVRNTFDGDNWVTPSQLRYLQDKAAKQAASGHFFENGKRITITLKRVGGASWPVQFGYRESTMYLEEYLTEDGKLIKYKGSSPLDINDEFVIVTGTVEHSEYNGQPETRLKRMKIANKIAA